MKTRLSALLLLIFLTSILGADETGRLEQGIQLYDEEQYAEAKEIFQSLAEEDETNAEVAFYLGRITLILDDDPKLAQKWLKKAVKYDDNNADYHFWLGQAYGIRAQNAGIFKAPGLAKKVKKEFLRAIELDPGHLDARFGLMQFYLQAPGIMGGSDEEAKEQVEEIKKRDPVMGCRASALVYEHDEKYDLAEQEYLNLIASDPDCTRFHYFLGFFYQEREKYAEAFATFEGILEAHPDELNAIYQIGRTGALSGLRPERAAECLQVYLLSEPGKDNPGIDWAHHRLAMVFQEAGEIDSARIHYQAALTINPKHKAAKKALKKLD